MVGFRSLRHIVAPIWAFSSFCGKAALFKFMAGHNAFPYPFTLVAIYSAPALVGALLWVILFKYLKIVFAPTLVSFFLARFSCLFLLSKTFLAFLILP